MVVDVSKVRRWAGRRFRMHGATDPAPASRHLAKVCAWAAVLSIGGIGVALRALIRLAYDDPGWYYVPVMVIFALIGLAGAIGAIASVQRSRTPFALLGVASVALLAAWLFS
jgi:cytochrome bd-type quinol oxidase subunit 2